MRFSIIVPVYNVEAYLRKCLDSVVNQSFDDYEIIVVDDETPDNSMDIVQDFVEKHPEKFQIIHQKNKGLGGARNTGVAVAKGEYLLFLDSDDYIHEQMLEILDQRIRENPCEMLIFNFYTALTSGKILSDIVFFQKDELVTDVKRKKELLQQPPAAWNKVYLRSFYMQSGVSFPERLFYEDVITRILVAKAERIQLCANSLYYYIQRPGSIMNSKVSPRVLEIKTIVEMVRAKCISDGLHEEYKKAIDAALIGSIICVIDGIMDQDRNHGYIEELRSYIREQFPGYETNDAMLPEVRSKVDCLLHKGAQAYYLRFSLLPRFNLVHHAKQALLRIPLIGKLNDLKKQNKRY